MFSKKHRVERDSFQKIMSEGEKISTRLFLIRFLNNNLGQNRFAAVVSKKVSKSAVKRHLIKRRILNSVRENMSLIKDGKTSIGRDFVFILSPAANDVSFKEVSVEIKNSFSKLFN